MSTSRFTPITSELFARKGDASPSGMKPSLAWTREPAVPSAPKTPPPPPTVARPHRMILTLSALEYEKLGIAAVKKGVSRHHILRSALDTHLMRLKREYGGCGCMAMGGPCGDACCD